MNIFNNYFKKAAKASDKTAYILLVISGLLFVICLCILENQSTNIACILSLIFSVVCIFSMLKALFPDYVKIYTKGFRAPTKSREEWRKIGLTINAVLLPLNFISFIIAAIIFLYKLL